MTEPLWRWEGILTWIRNQHAYYYIPLKASCACGWKVDSDDQTEAFEDYIHHLNNLLETL
jgi:hypothetical protein